MKVLNLQCAHQHGFEGWFGSEDDFTSQLARGLVSCPLCGDVQIQKMLSAPRLNLGRNQDTPTRPSAKGEPLLEVGHAAAGTELQGRLLRAVRELMAQTEDVGDRFADEARAMHQGDSEARSIRGQTTPEVAMELIEEGIDVMPLPALPALKETLQ
ncbi:MAG: DUF1178 family protein [Hydrogenophaga sp.]|jgi:hypothetical protein|nr:DUF1178 family protein [Hydrogenophaga sp.]